MCSCTETDIIKLLPDASEGVLRSYLSGPCRALRAAARRELERRGIHVPREFSRRTGR